MCMCMCMLCAVLLLRTERSTVAKPNVVLYILDTYGLHFRKFHRMCLSVSVFIFCFPSLSISIFSLAREPAIHHWDATYTYMYVKISFILVRLPKQTVFFFFLSFLGRFILCTFPSISDFSFGKAKVGLRTIRFHSQRSTRVQQTQH